MFINDRWELFNSSRNVLLSHISCLFVIPLLHRLELLLNIPPCRDLLVNDDKFCWSWLDDSRHVTGATDWSSASYDWNCVYCCLAGIYGSQSSYVRNCARCSLLQRYQWATLYGDDERYDECAQDKRSVTFRNLLETLMETLHAKIMSSPRNLMLRDRHWLRSISTSSSLLRSERVRSNSRWKNYSRNAEMSLRDYARVWSRRAVVLRRDWRPEDPRIQVSLTALLKSSDPKSEATITNQFDVSFGLLSMLLTRVSVNTDENKSNGSVP